MTALLFGIIIVVAIAWQIIEEYADGRVKELGTIESRVEHTDTSYTDGRRIVNYKLYGTQTGRFQSETSNITDGPSQRRKIAEKEREEREELNWQCDYAQPREAFYQRRILTEKEREELKNEWQNARANAFAIKRADINCDYAQLEEREFARIARTLTEKEREELKNEWRRARARAYHELHDLAYNEKDRENGEPTEPRIFGQEGEK